jgi:hypothetical protein
MNSLNKDKPSRDWFTIVIIILIVLFIIIWLVLIFTAPKTNIQYLSIPNTAQNTATLINLNSNAYNCCGYTTNGTTLDQILGYYISSLDMIVTTSASGSNPNLYCKDFTACQSYTNTLGDKPVDYCTNNSTTITDKGLKKCCDFVTNCASLSQSTSTDRAQNAIAFRDQTFYYVFDGGKTFNGGNCNFPFSKCS